MGILGDSVFGSGRGFRINVMEGAGAFVCGEETALMASIEGRRGMPAPKPPFPAECGLFGKPTIINNVETLASVPIVLALGAGEVPRHGHEGIAGDQDLRAHGARREHRSHRGPVRHIIAYDHL